MDFGFIAGVMSKISLADLIFHFISYVVYLDMRSCWPFQMTMDLLHFYVDVFFPLSLLRFLPDLTVWAILRRSDKKREPLTFYWWGQCCSFCLVSFCVVVLLVFTLRFPHKNDVLFVLSSSCLYEGSCLIYLICVCSRIVVSNSYCAVFLVCFIFVLRILLLVSLDYPILIAPSVFSNFIYTYLSGR